MHRSNNNSILVRWRWSAEPVLTSAAQLTFHRNKLLSLASQNIYNFHWIFIDWKEYIYFSDMGWYGFHFYLSFHPLATSVHVWQAFKGAVFEGGGWVMVFQVHLFCTSDASNDPFWWLRSWCILNRTTDEKKDLGREKSIIMWWWWLC